MKIYGDDGKEYTTVAEAKEADKALKSNKNIDDERIKQAQQAYIEAQKLYHEKCDEAVDKLNKLKTELFKEVDEYRSKLLDARKTYIDMITSSNDLSDVNMSTPLIRFANSFIDVLTR